MNCLTNSSIGKDFDTVFFEADSVKKTQSQKQQLLTFILS